MDKGYGILIVSVTIFVLCLVGTASATNWSVDDSGGEDFTGIQDAINNASDGDTIIVHSGVYYENVVVDKSVTLKGIGHPVVDARRCGESVVTLSADGITVEGFNVTKGSWEGAGITISSSNNTLTGNTVCHNNKEGIALLSSSNNTITDNNISNNICGIFLWHSSNNNAITGNNVSNNEGGIALWHSSNNNTITGNNVCSNEEGIRLRASNNNKIYFNNFIHNTYSVKSQSSTNIWNSPLEITYTYDGTTYKSYLGNYWDDYEGTDADGDGIGDTHYSIDSEKDESDGYPLMKPYENYNISTSAPA